jgi:hypothetical protein
MSPRTVVLVAGLPLLLLGCTSLPPKPDAPASGGVSPRARLADRDAVARYLPPDIRLDTPLDCDRPLQGNVESALVKAGARVGADGKLVSAAGKEIYFEITSTYPNATAAGFEQQKERATRYTVITVRRKPG